MQTCTTTTAPLCAFMFPGQVKQEPGIDNDIAQAFPEYETLKHKAHAALGFDLSQALHHGSDDLSQTRTSLVQPAVLLSSVARAQFLQSRNMQPTAVLGHSLGQFSALVLAGVLDFTDAVIIVYERGLLMEAAIQRNPGCMLAITSADKNVIEGILPEAAAEGCVVIGSINSSRQTVISGTNAAVAHITRIVEERHLGTPVPLCVQVPFHSPLLQDLQQSFANLLSGFTFACPKIAFIDNVTGEQVEDPELIRNNLVAHLIKPVLWKQCVETAHKLGCSLFVELGHKRMLAQFVRHNAPGQKALLWNEVICN